jgi:hypothetical protein
LRLDASINRPTSFTAHNYGFASEVGVKFRFAVSGKARWALLGYHFGGVRLGIKANGFTRLRHSRLVVEIGAGVF